MPSPRREAGISRAENSSLLQCGNNANIPPKYADKEQRLNGMASRIQGGIVTKAGKQNIFLFENIFHPLCRQTAEATVPQRGKRNTNNPCLACLQKHAGGQRYING